MGNTELVNDDSDELSTDRNIFMADIAGENDAASARHSNELPEDISAQELIANAGVEDDAHRDVCRRNQRHAQRRTNTE